MGLVETRMMLAAEDPSKALTSDHVGDDVDPFPSPSTGGARPGRRSPGQGPPFAELSGTGRRHTRTPTRPGPPSSIMLTVEGGEEGRRRPGCQAGGQSSQMAMFSTVKNGHWRVRFESGLRQLFCGEGGSEDDRGENKARRAFAPMKDFNRKTRIHAQVAPSWTDQETDRSENEGL